MHLHIEAPIQGAELAQLVAALCLCLRLLSKLQQLFPGSQCPCSRSVLPAPLQGSHNAAAALGLLCSKQSYGPEVAALHGLMRAVATCIQNQ